jgi:ATP-dependent Lon protease
MTEKLETYPVLPLRDMVMFPGMVIPLFVEREKSLLALDAAIPIKKLFLVSQKNSSAEDPKGKDLYQTGIVVNIVQVLKLLDGSTKVLVEGLYKAKATKYENKKSYIEASVKKTKPREKKEEDLKHFLKITIENFENYAKNTKKISSDVVASVLGIEDEDRLIDAITFHIPVLISEKQSVLEASSVEDAYFLLNQLMQRESTLSEVEKQISDRVKSQMEKSHRDFYLNEQMKAIQKELGDGDDSKSEFEELEAKIESLKLSKEAKTKALHDLKKLKMMNQMSAEATVIRNYLDWLLAMPWGVVSKEKKDIKRAAKILDEDHHGLEKVKERILEHLAVINRVKKIRGPVLCLVGPPGVGKTSLAKSIAKATGRNFIRIALGGVKDESEIRGHRKTYIGSMPGKIIQAMKKAKSDNPIILLDEIDKLSSDWKGDPTSALLEVLDPSQNKEFSDHYLEVEYDISKVMFIATANSTNMPKPLMDRMEMIYLSGYIEDEKLQIAQKHLVKKVKEENGIRDKELTITADAIRSIIRNYTREAGVRSLERELSKIARKVIKSDKSAKVDEKNIKDYLGVKKYSIGLADKENQIGMTNGLAWTEVGGELLPIEAIKFAGKGELVMTGKLGDVMKESIKAAMGYIRSSAEKYGINSSMFKEYDFHVHAPEGAVPKDGPSAGIAICTSLVSVMTNVPVRKDFAMTGEVTLRGRVLPIGGLKEKLIAAHRGGIQNVIIPQENVKDLEEIPSFLKNDLNIMPVSHVDQVIESALFGDNKIAKNTTIVKQKFNQSETLIPNSVL